MSIFFVELLDGVLKCGGDIPLGLIKKIFPVLLEKLHALNIIMILMVILDSFIGCNSNKS